MDKMHNCKMHNCNTHLPALCAGKASNEKLKINELSPYMGSVSDCKSQERAVDTNSVPIRATKLLCSRLWFNHLYDGGQ